MCFRDTGSRFSSLFPIFQDVFVSFPGLWFHNFFEKVSGHSDYGFKAYDKLSRFVYCLLQKIEKLDCVPPVEQWECYMLLNHSRFATIGFVQFLSGTLLTEALEKTNSVFLRKEFKKTASPSWKIL